YDNDDFDTTKPRRSAHDSAIFAHLRRNNPPRAAPVSRRSTDYLGVALPGEEESVAGRESMVTDRKSRGSIDNLRNPFGRDSTYDGHIADEQESEEELEVDLASWGLDALVSKEKDSKHSRKKTKPDSLPNPHTQVPAARTEPGRQRVGMRTMSMGGLNSFGEGGAFLDSQSSVPSLGARRHSIGSPLDLTEAQHSGQSSPRGHGRVQSAHALIENLPLSHPLHSIPFPTSDPVRSGSPNDGPSIARPSSRGSLLESTARSRAYSSASMGSKMLLNYHEEEQNPFAIRPPSPEHASRFDPKSARGRTASVASMGTIMAAGTHAEELNPFALQPPSPGKSSRFDPKATHVRNVSNGSIDHPYSKLDLMRPKVLIMPSPLQNTSAPPQTQLRSGSGFQLTTDGPPLPAGARSARRSSMTLSMLEPSSSGQIASNSFTPNPRMSLTLSQLTFRNTLMVDGQRDVAYDDIDHELRRATEDGEQIEPEPEPEPEPHIPVPAIDVEDPIGQKRPAGKLYGRSLIDDIEARKAEMRGKQRVFTGDQRPSMMARTPMKRSSTLIDPESLKMRPVSQRMDSFNTAPDLTRRNSGNIKPLLNFDDEIPGAPHQSLGVHPAAGGQKGSTRSVFGVDTIWERELAKLKEIEEQERVAAEERKKIEEGADAGKKGKRKGKKKGKAKGREQDQDIPIETTPTLTPEFHSESQRQPSPPHVLPMIAKTVVRRPPPPPADDDDSEDESDSSETPGPVIPNVARRSQVVGWHAGSSDEEEKGPRRTTGSGPRYPNQSSARPPQIVRKDGESSDEDVPLVATIGRAAQRLTRIKTDVESSEEEEPLSKLLEKTKLKLPSVGDSLSPRTINDDDDDDKPLGLRASRLLAPSNQEDDDVPLAFHPDQVRKTQYFMAQQQQQQQQQMMMQAQAAQLQQSMMYGAPSLMGSGFFGPPMAPMMMYPQLPSTPPPAQDVNKFGRVDKWRHDVAVEGKR
ncbi:hypothetical protein A0H81_09874, partial [Grifola frondosa]